MKTTRIKMYRDTYNDQAHTDLIESDSTIFDTLEDANIAAKTEWAHLTPHERQKNHIYVGVVDASMLNPDDIEEYGIEKAWGMICDCRYVVGFNSGENEND